MRPRPVYIATVLVVMFTCRLDVKAQQPAEPLVLDAFHAIAQHARRLQPMLDQVRAKEWVAQGAPETYITQVDSARKQIETIGTEMEALTQRSDHMQECMRGLFRVQAFHGSLESLLGGLRRYQNPELADRIQSVAAEDQGDIEKLQTYVLQLADEKEQEFQVVDHEAQRCRTILSKQPASKK